MPVILRPGRIRAVIRVQVRSRLRSQESPHHAGHATVDGHRPLGEEPATVLAHVSVDVATPVIEAAVGEDLEVAATGCRGRRLDVDLQGRGVMTDEARPGPGLVVATGLRRCTAKHLLDLASPPVRATRQMHHRVVGEELQHLGEPPGVAVGVVASHEVADLFPCVEFEMVHGSCVLQVQFSTTSVAPMASSRWHCRRLLRSVRPRLVARATLAGRAGSALSRVPDAVDVPRPGMDAPRRRGGRGRRNGGHGGRRVDGLQPDLHPTQPGQRRCARQRRGGHGRGELQGDPARHRRPGPLSRLPLRGV